MSHKYSCCNGGNHVSVSKFKKLATIATAAVSVSVLLTACQGKKSSSSTGTKTTKHSIALITDNNAIDDHSFNEAAWNGFKAFGKKHGLKQGKGGYQYFESSSAADFTPNANEAASSGFETIFGVGYQLTSAIKSAAKKNPKKNFVIIDDVISGQKNVASVTFESNQASYLAGIAAAYTTKTNHVGYIGGAKSATLELFEAGQPPFATDLVVTSDVAEFMNTLRGPRFTVRHVASFLQQIGAAALGQCRITDADGAVRKPRIWAVANTEGWVGRQESEIARAYRKPGLPTLGAAPIGSSSGSGLDRPRPCYSRDASDDDSWVTPQL